ncbi:MAG: DUF4157 domain-containing protein [Candidatus Electrothrix sp. GW3-4]|uniref:eCIS core domain-containing protein n=1 Tax=Candidatus Electrothrix sp. GW3-4 TaxID=3126740 RepID=UPI0030CF2CBF
MQAKDFHGGRQLKAEEPVQKQANRTGLPDNLKAGVENLSGMAMDDVRVHYNSDKPAQLQAHAYTQGTNIHIAPGQEKHLPHEAWHVVQQKEGRVQPTGWVGGKAMNGNRLLEKEADQMGRLSVNVHNGTCARAQHQIHQRKSVAYYKNSNDRTTQLVKARAFNDVRKEMQTNRILQGGKRVRHARDAEHGARERYLRKHPKQSQVSSGTATWRKLSADVKKHTGISYPDWKRKREAQHIIPASVGMKNQLPDLFINSRDNLMMLTGGRHGNTMPGPLYVKRKMMKQKYNKQGKNTQAIMHGRRVIHVGYKNRIAHPDYNDMAEKTLLKHAGTSKVTVAHAIKAANELRGKHKNPQILKYGDQLS